MSGSRDEWDRLSVQRRKSVLSLATEAIAPPVNFVTLRMSDDQLTAIKDKKVRKFYEVR